MERELYTYIETADALSKLRHAAAGIIPPLSNDESMRLFEIITWPLIGGIGSDYYKPMPVNAEEASDAS